MPRPRKKYPLISRLKFLFVGEIQILQPLYSMAKTEADMNNLKKIRTDKGFSQLALAKLTNIAPTDISRIENDWLRPYPGWRKRLAKALDTTESELFPAEKGGQDKGRQKEGKIL